ncbi:hypothetical protein KEM55_001002 [Ascosphaera atra]|nr:hypothetical protein KEM55_001002 [Ascosphaera atra]
MAQARPMSCMLLAAPGASRAVMAPRGGTTVLASPTSSLPGRWRIEEERSLVALLVVGLAALDAAAVVAVAVDVVVAIVDVTDP